MIYKGKRKIGLPPYIIRNHKKRTYQEVDVYQVEEKDILEEKRRLEEEAKYKEILDTNALSCYKK